MKENFYLSCLLASKICHDLIGSSSSLSFSMEILGENSKEINTDALQLATKSASVLVNRLKFFRAAYGISPIGTEKDSLSKLKELVINLFNEKDIYVKWLLKYDSIIKMAINNMNSKLILNLFLLIFYSIPKSATVRVIAADISEFEIGFMVEVKGYKTAFSEEAMYILNGDVSLEDINPRNIHIYFTKFLKEESGSKIEINNSVTKDGLKLACSLKKVI